MPFGGLLLASLIGFAASQPAWVPQVFVDWAVQHGKKFGSENQWLRAYRNYRENEHVIKELNSNSEEAAVYDHTIFSDLSPYDWKEKFFGSTMSPEEGKRGGSENLPPANGAIPESVDWRAQGAVTPVKSQGVCGSCWAESAVANIESMWYLAHKATMKAPVPLSTEQVIECDKHDNACYGGYPKGGFEYVIEHGGLAAKADYPYDVNGRTICLANQSFNASCGDGMCDDPPLTSWCDVKCSDARHKSVAHIASWHALPTDEGLIAAQLAQHGPVSVAIDASGGWLGVLFPWLQFYKKGVANPKRCTTTLDHAVLLIGYGEDQGQKYWLVKNSWGEKWGEEGYFRLIRGVGRCGVNLLATSSTVSKPSATSTGRGVIV